MWIKKNEILFLLNVHKLLFYFIKKINYYYKYF